MMFFPDDSHKTMIDSFGLPLFFSSFSALDRFFGEPSGQFLSLASTASLIEIAACFENPEFPGLDGVDVAVRMKVADHTGSGISESFLSSISGGTGEEVLLISCQLNEGVMGLPGIKSGGRLQGLLYSPLERRFFDPSGIYPLLRINEPLDGDVLGLNGADSWEPFLDAAILVARYPFVAERNSVISRGAMDCPRTFPPVDSFRQREVLVRILEGKNPRKGLELLRLCGFTGEYWPELQRMVSVSHGKEYHPEGDVWEHTLETFSYRKNRNPVISLALLLHDMGKPSAEEQEGNRFHQHAQLGGREASRFLNRLGFSRDLIEAVVFLVNKHMLPGLTRKLPSFRVEEVLASPLYPLLLEVYRCDLSSTFRGPDGYYEACKVYRRFLKNRRNPFRGSDGKKILKYWVAN